MDISALSQAVTGIKTIGKLALDLVHLKDEAARQAKVIELQQVILDTQSSAFAAQAIHAQLAEEVGGLKQRIADMEAWDKTAQRYKLHEFVAGCFTYGVKIESKESDPPHWVCATCFQDKERSILQIKKEDVGRKDFYVCPRCKTSIYLGHGFDPAKPRYLE